MPQAARQLKKDQVKQIKTILHNILQRVAASRKANCALQGVTAAHAALPGGKLEGGSSFYGARTLAPPLPEHREQLGFIAVGAGGLSSLSKCGEYGLGHVFLSIEGEQARVGHLISTYWRTDSNIVHDLAQNLSTWFAVIHRLGLRQFVHAGHVTLSCRLNSPLNIHCQTRKGRLLQQVTRALRVAH